MENENKGIFYTTDIMCEVLSTFPKTTDRFAQLQQSFTLEFGQPPYFKITNEMRDWAKLHEPHILEERVHDTFSTLLYSAQRLGLPELTVPEVKEEVKVPEVKVNECFMNHLYHIEYVNGRWTAIDNYGKSFECVRERVKCAYENMDIDTTIEYIKSLYNFSWTVHNIIKFNGLSFLQIDEHAFREVISCPTQYKGFNLVTIAGKSFIHTDGWFYDVDTKIEVKEVLPEVKEVLPEVKEVLPEVKEVLPEVKEVLPEVKEVLPEVKEEVKVPERIDLDEILKEIVQEVKVPEEKTETRRSKREIKKPKLFINEP
jgi:hypothetical protein